MMHSYYIGKIARYRKRYRVIFMVHPVAHVSTGCKS